MFEEPATDQHVQQLANSEAPITGRVCSLSLLPEPSGLLTSLSVALSMCAVASTVLWQRAAQSHSASGSIVETDNICGAEGAPGSFTCTLRVEESDPGQRAPADGLPNMSTYPTGTLLLFVPDHHGSCSGAYLTPVMSCLQLSRSTSRGP